MKTLCALLIVGGLCLVAPTAQGQNESRRTLLERAKSLELNTPYVPPPGDPMEHHASGYAKIMCSSVFITGLDPEFARENVGYFVAPYAERPKLGTPRITAVGGANPLVAGPAVVRAASTNQPGVPGAAAVGDKRMEGGEVTTTGRRCAAVAVAPVAVLVPAGRIAYGAGARVARSPPIRPRRQRGADPARRTKAAASFGKRACFTFLNLDQQIGGWHRPFSGGMLAL